MHNPESEMHKLSQELKEGRQKRIQIIDGQEVVTHVKAEEETEDEEESDMDMDQEEQVMYIFKRQMIISWYAFLMLLQVVSIEGEDGHQYVVLEVIQMQNQDGNAVTNNDTELMGDDFLLNDGKLYIC